MPLRLDPYGQLGSEIPRGTVDPVSVEDLQRQRRTLERLGFEKGWLGDVNAFRTKGVQMRDATRDDLRERLLGGGSGAPAANAASGGGLGGAASSAAKGAAKEAAMSAMGASL